MFVLKKKQKQIKHTQEVYKSSLTVNIGIQDRLINHQIGNVRHIKFAQGSAVYIICNKSTQGSLVFVICKFF